MAEGTDENEKAGVKGWDNNVLGSHTVGTNDPKDVMRIVTTPDNMTLRFIKLQSIFGPVCLLPFWLSPRGIGILRLMNTRQTCPIMINARPSEIIVALYPNEARRAETTKGKIAPPAPVPPYRMPVARPRRAWNHSNRSVAAGTYEAEISVW